MNPTQIIVSIKIPRLQGASTFLDSMHGSVAHISLYLIISRHGASQMPLKCKSTNFLFPFPHRKSAVAQIAVCCIQAVNVLCKPSACLFVTSNTFT